MSERESARDTYDALIDLFPDRGIAEVAYALVKRTYRVLEGGRLELDAPQALFWNVRDPELNPRWKPGSDYWFFKNKTDVAVKGSTFHLGGRSAPKRQIALSVGEATKRVEVFGRRVIEWAAGRPRISEPEPFEEVEVSIENAYGGADERVPVREGELTVLDHQRLLADHPGLYPRNPFGKGYVVLEDPVEGIELPHLEDPDRLLTAEALFVKDPRDWWKQPLPWSLDWTNGLMFPRYLYLGTDAWFPAPRDAELEEVRRGFLHRDWRALEGAVDADQGAPPAEFFQEGAFGQVFEPLAPGTPISVRGMHPERERLQLVVPPPPRLELDAEGKRHELALRLINVLVEPGEERVSFTWSGTFTKLPRVFIPHIHVEIPLAIRVDGDAPIAYVAPPTVRAQLEAAKAEGKLVKTPAEAREVQRGLDAGAAAAIASAAAPDRALDAAPAPAPREARDPAAIAAALGDGDEATGLEPAAGAAAALGDAGEPTGGEAALGDGYDTIGDTDSLERPLEPEGAPSRSASIDEAPSFTPPFTPPAGAARGVAPVWQSDGDRTGKLVLPDAAGSAPLAKTEVLSLPIAAQTEDIPPTREVVLPEARGAQPTPPRETTLILDEAQLRGQAPVPTAPKKPAAPPARSRPAVREHTLILTEEQMRGEAPVPTRSAPGTDETQRPTRPDAAPLSEQPTVVLRPDASVAIADAGASHDFGDDLSTQITGSAPPSEAVVLREGDAWDAGGDAGGTQVLDVEELSDVDDDDDGE